jgi:hypothetical protein
MGERRFVPEGGRRAAGSVEEELVVGAHDRRARQAEGREQHLVARVLLRPRPAAHPEAAAAHGDPVRRRERHGGAAL